MRSSLTKRFHTKQGVLKLMVGALRPLYCITVRSEGSKPISDKLEVIRLLQTIERIPLRRPSY